MPRKTFVANEILTASDVNEFLMDQSVMVFAGTAARGSAIPSPSEGMVTYRSDDDIVEVYDGSAFVPVAEEPVAPAILQVVSTTKTDSFSTTSTTFTDVTGLTVSITPTSASSKILILANVQHSFSLDNGSFAFKLNGGNSSSYVGEAGGDRIRGVFGQTSGITLWDRPDLVLQSSSIMFLDSPSTTSSTTYAVQAIRVTSGTLYVNRMGDDADQTNRTRGASSITVMEVAG